MFKLFILLTLSTSVLACTRLIANGSPSPLATQHAMSSTSISVKRASLIAREATTQPVGTLKKLDLPVYSAAVFIELENLKEADSIVRIQKLRSKIAPMDGLNCKINNLKKFYCDPYKVPLATFI